MSVLFNEQSIEIYKSLIDYNPDAIFTFSIKGNIVGFNQAVIEMFGYSKEEILKLSYKDIFIPDQLEQVKQLLDKVTQGIPCEYEADAFHKDGGMVHLQVKNVPLIVGEEVIGVFGVAKDITAMKKVEESLKVSEERYRLITKNMTDLVAIWDVNGVVKYASPSHELVLGFTSEVYEGNHAFDLIHPDDIPHVQSQFMNMVLTKENQVMEFRYKHVKGNLVWMEAKGTPNIDDEGNLLHFLVIAREITERKLFEEKLNHMAYHDTLTGIPNRRFFQERLEQALKEAGRYRRKLAVMYMDLDKFKHINDTFGHDVGDELLKQISERVQGCLRESDILARQGGDEFTILFSEIQEEQIAIQIAERILTCLQAPWNIGKYVIHTTSSIGIAFYPTDGTTTGELMKHADTALYEVKENGRNKVKTYS